MTTKYIGARYITKFADPIEWNENNAYEQNTAVQYQGFTYLSKQPVPKRVDINNSEYWLKWADPNSQMSVLQSTVNDLSSQYDDIQDSVEALEETSHPRHALYIGNSFALGTGNENVGIFAKTRHLFDKAYLKYISGAGFDQYSGHTANQTFSRCLSNAYNDSTIDSNAITDVIFVSAMGDTRANCEGQNMASLKTTINLAKQYFPNAQIYIYYAEIISTKNNQNTGSFAYGARYAIYQIRTHLIFQFYAQEYGYTYLGWGGWPINFDSSYTSSDGYHPNDKGYNYLSQFLISAFNGVISYPTKYFVRNNIAYVMTNPLEGTMRTGPVSKALFTGDLQSGNATVASKIFNESDTDKNPYLIPPMTLFKSCIAETSANTGQNNKYCGMDYHCRWDDDTINVTITPRQNVALSDISRTALYGTGFYLDVKMWATANLNFS